MAVTVKVLNMKWVLVSFASWILFFGQNVTSQDIKPRYFLLSVNYLVPDYPEPVASRAAFASHIPESTHIPLHVDALGYYRAYGNLTLMGAVMQIDIDRYSAYGESLQIECYQPSFSVFHYLDGQIGAGLFARGDIGPAFMRLYSGDRGTEKTNFGWGYLLGAGAALGIRSTILLASINYAHKSFQGASYNFYSMGLGIMLKKSP